MYTTYQTHKNIHWNDFQFFFLSDKYVSHEASKNFRKFDLTKNSTPGGTDLGVVELSVGQVFAVRGDLHSDVGAENLLLVNPVYRSRKYSSISQSW